jgi:hypothetical protein
MLYGPEIQPKTRISNTRHDGEHVGNILFIVNYSNFRELTQRPKIKEVFFESTIAHL